jgi:hypothetical protein
MEKILITVEELNDAYKIAKKEGEKINSSLVKVHLARDPITWRNINIIYNPDNKEIPIVLNLNFEFDYKLGGKGYWYCISEVEVIDLDNE